jgi:hypothetical protein
MCRKGVIDIADVRPVCAVLHMYKTCCVTHEKFGGYFERQIVELLELFPLDPLEFILIIVKLT